MRFKEFLREDSSLISVAKGFKKNLTTVISKKLFLFRNSDHGSLKIDSQTNLYWAFSAARSESRKSKTGNNVLMRWVDEEWKDYPKRSLSYFATRGLKHSKLFNNGAHTRVIIPADSIKKFAYTPVDFNMDDSASTGNFDRSTTSIMCIDARNLINSARGAVNFNVGSEIASTISSVIRAHGLSNDDVEGGHPKNLAKWMLVLDELMEMLSSLEKRAGTGGLDANFIRNFKEKKEEMKDEDIHSFADFFKNLTPKQHNVQLYTSIAKLPQPPGTENLKDEIWFQGDYLSFAWYGEDDMLDMFKDLAARL